MTSIGQQQNLSRLLESCTEEQIDAWPDMQLVLGKHTAPIGISSFVTEGVVHCYTEMSIAVTLHS